MFYKKGALKEISTFHFFSRKSALNRYQYFMKDVPGQHYMFGGVSDVVLVSLLLALNRFHTLLSCNDFWLWTSKCLLGWQTMTQELLVFWRRICCRLFTEFAKSLASIAHNQLLSCFSKILTNLLRDTRSVCEIITEKNVFIDQWTHNTYLSCSSDGQDVILISYLPSIYFRYPLELIIKT